MAAPMCVVLIAKCMAVTTSSGDVGLEECHPEPGFKYVSQPKSLRACLRQVCNETYDAMATAPANLLAISLASGGIPDHIRTMYEALTVYSPVDMEVCMLLEAEFDQSEVAKCARNADDVNCKFQSATNLLNDVLACCEGKKGMSEREATKTNQDKEAYGRSLEYAKENLRKFDEQMQANAVERETIQKEIDSQASTTSPRRAFFGSTSPADPMPRPTTPRDPVPGANTEDLHVIDCTYEHLLACSLEDKTTLESLATDFKNMHQAMVKSKHKKMVAFMERHTETGRSEYLAIAPPAQKKEFDRQASEVEAEAVADAGAAASAQQEEEGQAKRARFAYEGH
ncbi:Aste57867_13625 [Aphanomyces stellatus]|uniref:Aste57867_13625 protein n=1 Tax=Aphanomyces stellatus TaxID=120398 RepID=A0A485KYV9_9STRA|nr:hypothetical protein As57867_013575 [Aphanomyces stellatus]VFT90462.1 Aste57867_13625 [Aphanomyces stellatus]